MRKLAQAQRRSEERAALQKQRGEARAQAEAQRKAHTEAQHEAQNAEEAAPHPALRRAASNRLRRMDLDAYREHCRGLPEHLVDVQFDQLCDLAMHAGHLSSNQVHYAADTFAKCMDSAERHELLLMLIDGLRQRRREGGESSEDEDGEEGGCSESGKNTGSEDIAGLHATTVDPESHAVLDLRSLD